ncbi:peptidyl-prolyl cis-trans isomerase FKBP14 isoform X2 [Eptesicus fuscus]|uniref:peptidyl-prolyl cis-trans isomerase FKBP14 isoform X2 n=1 Tax=Eptesicus fuscus TaxID=29078 RepID=UPI0024048C48|nr:peptidyl-prolyl cis-trans isomerase FKBP14 isoform X2 [Eptesicus fuscus]XP_054582452.1 peptidyl-prolyl cis-trans isomerase FKBP14 isoform X2 [Eptesicus fuscus]
MRLCLWNSVLTLLVTSLSGALIPEPEVKIEVLQRPFICHRKTKGGDLMLVHYEGYLEKDGSLFHSTHKHNNGQPIWFTLGILEALKGWDQGLKGMCVGEKRKLVIPPALGYGKEGKGKIPPESTLIFNIDLLEIRNGPRSHESFQEMDLNDDWKLSKDEDIAYLCSATSISASSLLPASSVWVTSQSCLETTKGEKRTWCNVMEYIFHLFL